MSDQQQGNGAPEAPQGDATKGISEADVVRIVNAAISSRYKSQDTKLQQIANDLTAKFEEAFKGRTPEQPSAPEGQKAPSSIEEHPQFKGMQKQLEELRKKTEAAEQKAAAERAKARDQSLRAKVASSLAEGGIDGTRAKLALGVLVDSMKSVRYAGDDSDDLVFSHNGEDLDFATGLKGWLGSDDAKIFLPPRGTAGSGQQPIKGQNGSGGAPADPRDALRAALIARFGGDG